MPDARSNRRRMAGSLRPRNGPRGRASARMKMTTGTEVPAGCLGLQGFSGPGNQLMQRLRNAHRWRLWICADYVRRLSGCLLTFARPVETGTPPPKRIPIRLGGGEGNRTPVQNASRLPELQPWFYCGGTHRGFQGPCAHDAIGQGGFGPASRDAQATMAFADGKLMPPAPAGKHLQSARRACTR